VENRSVRTAPYGRKGRNPITLRNLDLSHVPNENDLRTAGQLGGALTPTGPAEPSRIKDPAKRKRQEADNMAFGRAMNKWNRHHYHEAVELFKEHIEEHPDSPWRGESDLHLGCAAQFTGRWIEAQERFEAVLSYTEPGCDMYQKALLRKAVLLMERGEPKKSKEAFAEMLRTETSWERTTYAQNWIRTLNLYEANMKQVRTCGNEAVAQIVRWQGNEELARELMAKEAHGDYGFTLAELQMFAKEAGLDMTAVRASEDQLDLLPTPFIAHYSDEHFVVVNQLKVENGKWKVGSPARGGEENNFQLRVYDPRLHREVEMSAEEFCELWSGLALVLGGKPDGVYLATEEEMNKVGGCCGKPRPEDLDDDCENDQGSGNDGCGSGGSSGNDGCFGCGDMPTWDVNPITMNHTVKDSPLGYASAIGPSVRIGLTYHSLDALNELRPMGNKWTLNYASYAVEDPGGAVTIVMPSGARSVYQPISTYVAGAKGRAGTYKSPPRKEDHTLLKTG